PDIIEAFTYYVQTFPDNSQVSAALAQRALAYEQDKNYDAALSDLNTILTKYPSAHEREAALQLKALILGQQDKTKGMVETFRQLLKEFPKSSVAAQAQYYIGKAAFEAKDYKTAMSALNAARQLNNLPEAEDAFAKYLQVATDPAGKAKVLLALGAVKIGAHKPDDAQKIAEEIMALQPEGRVNAEARLLAGEVQLERGNFDDAGKAFKGVALLYDDPAITPRALDKAALAYRQAGKTDEADRLSRQ